MYSVKSKSGLKNDPSNSPYTLLNVLTCGASSKRSNNLPESGIELETSSSLKYLALEYPVSIPADCSPEFWKEGEPKYSLEAQRDVPDG